MKKYVKPDVVFEGFELSQHIAGGCNILMNQGDVLACENITAGEGNWGLGGIGHFAEGGSCTLPTEGPTCYYNSADGFPIFKS